MSPHASVSRPPRPVLRAFGPARRGPAALALAYDLLLPAARPPRPQPAPLDPPRPRGRRRRAI